MVENMLPCEVNNKSGRKYHIYSLKLQGLVITSKIQLSKILFNTQANNGWINHEIKVLWSKRMFSHATKPFIPDKTRSLGERGILLLSFNDKYLASNIYYFTSGRMILCEFTVVCNSHHMKVNCHIACNSCRPIHNRVTQLDASKSSVFRSRVQDLPGGIRSL